MSTPTKIARIDHVDDDCKEDASSVQTIANVTKHKKVAVTDVAIPDDWDRCQFYMKKKRRFCRSFPASDKLYCVEHLYLLGDGALKKRVPCPLDPKHSCYEDQLKKHLNKCNARPDMKPVFHVQNINSSHDDTVQDIEPHQVSVRTVKDEEILKIIAKVQKLYEEHVVEVPDGILFHDVLKEECEKSVNSHVALKHIYQQASLVAHAESLGLTSDNQVFVEFGAGKGGLSHWVQRAMKTSDQSQFILVDRSSVRYKMDSFHRGENQGPCFERLKIDIEHFDMGKVPSLKDHNRSIVGISKHLCGVASDLMLRCLVNSSRKNQDSGSRKVSGIVLALCCHHRCEWHNYIGREFFTQCGLTVREFYLIRSLTSWATCAIPNQLQDDEHGHLDESFEKDQKGDELNNLTVEEKEATGYQCKRLIDIGRVKFLEKAGFEVKLAKYVTRQHSPEDVALLAKAKSVECKMPETTQTEES